MLVTMAVQLVVEFFLEEMLAVQLHQLSLLVVVEWIWSYLTLVSVWRLHPLGVVPWLVGENALLFGFELVIKI